MDSARVASSVAEAWLALVIGNTRLHWGYFVGDRLLNVWHTPHLEREAALRIQSSGFDADAWHRVPGLVYSEVLDSEVLDSEVLDRPSGSQPSSTTLSPRSLWIASVVPEQTALWANQRFFDNDRLNSRVNSRNQNSQVPARVVERSQIPLQNLYATLGIDRAINLLGASHLNCPVLVIDAGTALTFTAGQDGAVLGGAILPGMQLQARALAQQTANLPLADDWLASQADLPKRWATTTDEAIASGLVYGTISILADYLADWWRQFPKGAAVLTGGDSPTLHALLQQKTPEIASRVTVDSHLMFKGMQRYRSGAILLL